MITPQRCPECRSGLLAQQGDDWSCLRCGNEFGVLDVIRDISPFLNEDGESVSAPKADEIQTEEEKFNKAYTYPEFLATFFPNIKTEDVERCPVCDGVVKSQLFSEES